MKKALFFPSYFGGGFGHIGRCLALAQSLVLKGWEASFVLSGPQANHVQKAGFPVFHPWLPKRSNQKCAPSPAYTYFLNGNIQVLRDGFINPWLASAAFLEALWTIKKNRPDVIIGDFSLLSWMLGLATGLPVVQIAQAISYPLQQDIIWWDTPPEGMVSPDIEPVFKPLLRRLKQNPVNKIQDLLRGDLYLIPSIPELDPLPRQLPNTHYIGPLLYHDSTFGDLPVFFNGRDEKPLVYVTVGGGAGPVGSMEFFKVINEASKDAAWRTVVSTGRKFNPVEFFPVHGDISYHQWLPGQEMIRKSKAVVFHGGYTTMMETVAHGVPSMTIPFHSEQEGNGRRLEALSAGFVFSPSCSKIAKELLRFPWKYGECLCWVQKPFHLSVDTLREGISQVLFESRLKEGVLRLKSKIQQYQGAGQGVELIENLLR